MAIIVEVNDAEVIQLQNITEKAVDKSLKTVTEVFAGNTREKINRGEQRTGREYVNVRTEGGNVRREYNPSLFFGRPTTISSAKGENPKTDTGLLVATIRSDFKKIKTKRIASIFVGGGSVDYADDLEDSERPILKDTTTTEVARAFNRILIINRWN